MIFISLHFPNVFLEGGGVGVPEKKPYGNLEEKETSTPSRILFGSKLLDKNRLTSSLRCSICTEFPNTCETQSLKI